MAAERKQDKTRTWWHEHRVIWIPAAITAAATLLAALFAIIPDLTQSWGSRDESRRDQIATCMDQFGMKSNPESTKVWTPDSVAGDRTVPIWRQTFESCQWPAGPHTDDFGHTEIVSEMYDIDSPDSHPYVNKADRINATCPKVELSYTTGYVQDEFLTVAEQGTQILAAQLEGDNIFPSNTKFFNGPASEIVALHGGLVWLDSARCLEK